MTDETRTVFIANKSAHDFDGASAYGKLVYVTQGFQQMFSVNHHTRTWAKVLKDSKPDDFLVLTSMNSLCAVGAALFAMMHGRLNILLYRKGKYIPRQLNLAQVMNAEGLLPDWKLTEEETEDDSNAE